MSALKFVRVHNEKLISCIFGTMSLSTDSKNSALCESSFKPKKVLLVTKLSRYDFEKRRHPDLNEGQLADILRSRGSDYNKLLYHHYIHKGVENTVFNALSAAGIETKVVNRLDYTEGSVEWADAVFTAGGDGTFLLAASRILNSSKPVIGFNSDPTRSKGHLCLPRKYSVDVREAVDKLLTGRFKWTFRSRIRVTLFGKRIFEPPIELHDQQLLHPENRYLDMDHQLKTLKTFEPVDETGEPYRVLPLLALNEVFIGECVSARVSYLELGFDGRIMFKEKCSGLIASTGTGSTSWTYNINKLTEQSMGEILTFLKEEMGCPVDLSVAAVTFATNRFNQKLIINPDDPRIVYTIRDHVHSSSEHFSQIKPRGLARNIKVKSRCFDASLVIDGGASFVFNDGTRALLSMHNEDALRTVSL